MNQLALPLVWPPDPSDDDFLLSASNRMAAQMLRDWPSWPDRVALLTGPRKSGRSLLARLFAGASGGQVIDDAEAQGETALFHAWNAAQAGAVPLLIVADAPPPEWRVRLPDLRTRLAATPVARILPPDEALAAALLERGFLRRGLDARPDLIQWLTARLERSHLALIRAIDALDAAAFSSHRRLSIPLARATLAAAGLIPGQAAESGDIDGPPDARRNG
ncbi:chromosomal replication initiator DnaA [Sphingomonas sp.]|uniref:HdaA/DnaA family protein n=1 Tax=Sphingomonas sp. TaxID=28214 RepID=UPI001DB407C4|nr:chromosomal replication initiator DnaA [Sphingomonas sp.]MBX9796749.1 chromosomal replication initiator DnaA [Sphingomonas sp.]